MRCLRWYFIILLISGSCFSDDAFFESFVEEEISTAIPVNARKNDNILDDDDGFIEFLLENHEVEDCKSNERCTPSYFCSEARNRNDGKGRFDERMATVEAPEGKCTNHDVCCDVSENPPPGGPHPTKKPVVSSTSPSPPPVREEYCQANHECVKLSKCHKLADKTHGNAASRYRRSSKKLKIVCPASKVCCEETKPSQYIETHEKIRAQKCKEGRELNGTRKCGERNEKGITVFPIKGPSTQFGEHPYMLAILFKFDDGDTAFICGGSLITKSVALTAAHCVNRYSPSDLIVRAGEWDARNQSEMCLHEETTVDEIKVHEFYSPGTKANDIALLVLHQPYKLDRLINTICLSEEGTYTRTNEKCITLGWGADSFDDDKYFYELLKGSYLETKNNSTDCQTLIRQQLGNYKYEFNENFICTVGNPQFEIKYGDGGGPLICKVKDGKDTFYIQKGIAIGVFKNKQKLAKPVTGTYLDVSKYIQWINDNLTEKRHEKGDYERSS